MAADNETLRHLAYAQWHKRGCPMGSPEIDWKEAEAILNDKGSPEQGPVMAPPVHKRITHLQRWLTSKPPGPLYDRNK